jgi:alpha-galactosidase
MYMSRDGRELVLLAYQILNKVNNSVPAVRLQGLMPLSKYTTDEGDQFTGDTLMNVGLRLPWKGDHDSRVMFFKRE